LKKLKDFFVNTIDSYPIYMGVIFLIIGILILAYQINKNESFNMNKHGLASWQVFVNTWGVGIMITLWGIILIIRNY
jgi:hypothetical protein|tara:strand:+ start:46 stop:276 length:231 start_codon:yes stop_codon:yes gene_type:complete